MIVLEDTWQDVLLKAMRGLAYNTTAVAVKSGLTAQEVDSLLQGTLHQENLLRLAPVLSLNPHALLALAQEKEYIPPLLPKQMCCLTSSYHDMEVHAYLLWSEKNRKAIAFDTGTNSSLLLEELSRHQLTLVSIFLTHGHADHCMELTSLIKATGAEAWSDSDAMIPDTNPLPPHFSYQLDDTLSIATRSTPGHSAGGITYLISGLSSPIAIVGDAIFARSAGGIPSASYTSALNTIQNNILSLPSNTILCPGHGPLTTVQEEQHHNPLFAKKIL